MAAQNNYDPMQEFWKRGFDFLFKQSPVIVLAVTGLYLLWQKTERMETLRIKDRIEVRSECADAINAVRIDLSNCQHKNEVLSDNYQKVLVELSSLKAVVTRWGKRGESYGVRE